MILKKDVPITVVYNWKLMVNLNNLYNLDKSINVARLEAL